MNKSIHYLYQALAPKEKKQLFENYENAPKMLAYLHFLEQSPKPNAAFTDRVLAIIYEKEIHQVEEHTLINRFYKLRQSLHQKLIHLCRNQITIHTEEVIELQFLELLASKDEYSYLLPRAQKLEQKCWDSNLFEILPDVLHLIALALHSSQANNIDLQIIYHDKLEKANELLSILNQLKHLTNSFRLDTITLDNRASLGEAYKKAIHKIQRKIRGFDYPRFKLIYHYTSFIIGSNLQDIAINNGNILTRHLNQLDKLMEQYPTMPILRYRKNHRIYDTDSLLIKKSLYWYVKKNTKKSIQYIVENVRLKDNNPTIYIPTSEPDTHNLLICCFGTKEYFTSLHFIEQLKEFQLKNKSVTQDIPYFIYEMIAYSGMYPKHKHPAPELLTNKAIPYLEKHGEKVKWVFEPVSEFTLLYGFLDICERYATHPILLQQNSAYGIKHSTKDVLKLVKNKDKDGLLQLLKEVKQAKKNTTSTVLIHHLEDIRQLIQKLI